MLSIGQLSERTRVKVPTIRYYEDIGLLAADGRTAGNQRRYSRDSLARLGFIRHARDLGLPIKAIRTLIALQSDTGAPCHDAHKIAANHLSDIRARITRLQRLESELSRIATACDGDAPGQCNVLNALADHMPCSTEH
jgi:DNA-binding transcriptional MerR regulator